MIVRGLATDAEARFPSLTAMLAELTRDRDRGRRRTIGFAIGGAAVVLAAVATFAIVRLGNTRATDAAACSAVPSMLAGVWDDDARARVGARAPSRTLGHALVARLDDYANEWLAQRRAIGAQRDEAYVERVQCLDSAKVALGTVRTLLASAGPGVFEAPGPLLSTLPSLAECKEPAGALRWITPPIDAAATASRESIRERVQRGFAFRGAGKVAEARAVARELDREVATLAGSVARADAARFAALYTDDPKRGESLLRTSIASATASRYELGVVNAYGDYIGLLLTHRRFDDAISSLELADADDRGSRSSLGRGRGWHGGRSCSRADSPTCGAWSSRSAATTTSRSPSSARPSRWRSRSPKTIPIASACP